MSTNTLNPDLEYYVGKLQPQYESPGQAEIGRMLDQYGVPFFYKQPMLICDNGQRKVWHPDFTLPTYNNAVIEYDSKRDRAIDRGQRKLKEHVYRQNGIGALFLDRSDLARPDWQDRLYDQLEEIYHRPLAYRGN